MANFCFSVSWKGARPHIPYTGSSVWLVRFWYMMTPSLLKRGIHSMRLLITLNWMYYTWNEEQVSFSFHTFLIQDLSWNCSFSLFKTEQNNITSLSLAQTLHGTKGKGELALWNSQEIINFSTICLLIGWIIKHCQEFNFRFEIWKHNYCHSFSIYYPCMLRHLIHCRRGIVLQYGLLHD